ncbi:MAG: elongation factor P, partial [Burkholderiaceae bacterium]|nr:elongation factor P [Burkholderiaceae bacterium]
RSGRNSAVVKMKYKNLLTAAPNEGVYKADDKFEVVFYDGRAISVELPTSVVREITYTEPAVKGDTSSGKVLKSAKIATGFEVQVPLFCTTGDKIEIDTRTGEYRSRAN